MIRQIFNPLCCFFTLYATAQPEIKDYKNQVKVSILRVVDPDNPGIEINYERYFSQRFSTEIAIARMANIVVKNGRAFEGFRIGVEEKYFTTPIRRSGFYLSLQGVYNNSSLKNENDFRLDTVSNTYINSPYTIKKVTAAFNFKSGIQFQFHRFVIDYNMGFGVKFRKIQHVNRRVPFQAGNNRGFFFNRNMEASEWTINLPLSIKLGYSF